MRINVPNPLQKSTTTKEVVNTKRGTTSSSNKTIVQGEVVKGEIVDIGKNQIKVQLSTGQTIEARTTEQFDFFIGQNVSFIVKESGMEQLLLKPLVDEDTLTQYKLLTILENAGLPNTSENMKLLSTLYDNNMPIDKETLAKLANTMKQFPGANLGQVLLLMKNNIPVTPETLKQLQQLLGDDKKVMHQLASMSDDLSSAFKDSEGIKIVNQLLKGNKEATSVFSQLQSHLSQVTESEEQTPVLVKQFLSQKDQSFLSDTSAKMLTQQHSLKEPIFTTQELSALQNLQEEESLAAPQIKNTKSSESPLSLQGKAFGELFTQVDDLQLPADVKQSLNNILAQKVTHSLLNSELMMNASHLGDIEKTSDYFNKIHEKVMDVLKMDVNNPGGKIGEIMQNANDLKGALELMNNLNQQYNFMQMPMMLNDQLTNAELYVMNQKKDLKNPKATVTALIRLDMLNLGHLDIYAAKTDKNVDIKIYMNDEKQAEFVRANAYKLFNQINSKGFNVQGVSVMKSEKEVDIFEDFFKDSSSKSKVKRYTFDVRA